MANVSTLGQALNLIDRIKDQQSLFTTLSTQLATGKKTQEFSGLDSNVLVSKRARASFASLEVYTNNIVNADRRINLMLSALSEFKAQAENLQGVLIGFSQQSAHQQGDIVYWDDPATTTVVEEIPVGYSSADPSVDFQTLQDLSASIFSFLGDLVNAQDGERYLFSGADSLTQPLDISGTLDASITTMISDWKDGTITNDELFANLSDRTTSGGNLDALTDSIIGYSAPLSNGNAGNIFVRLSETTEIDYTALANADPLRDIMVIAAYLSNATLSPMADEVTIDPGTGLPVVITDGAPGATIDESKDNFFAMFNNMVKMMSDAVDNIDQMRFSLENTRARLDQTKQGYANEQNLLLNTIGDVENVDISDVAVRLNSLQIQLEASFRITARMQELSLINFI